MITDHTPSVRAQVVTRRTYNRPLNDEGTIFETWEQTISRVIQHQQWLWENAKGKKLNKTELAELEELRELMLDRKTSLSGRTLWLGGTDIAKKRASSQFNCSFSKATTVHDLVDHCWLLLQGAGVGHYPDPGTLNGFSKFVETIDTIPSTITKEDWDNGYRGEEKNKTRFYTKNKQKVWHLTIGDSAESWAKALGKILAMKTPVDRIILDFSQIRPEGIRLKGYGWISSGYLPLATALIHISNILNKQTSKLLSKIDILDIENHIGTMLSSRRSAEISLVDYDSPEWLEFATAKKDFFIHNPHRAQSNNSLLFNKKPSIAELLGIFSLMEKAGGSEPGFINMESAQKRAPWTKGFNPCSEICLGNHSFCNLCETNLNRFNGNVKALHRAIVVMARANYRQTCVDLRDGILQESWHELNEFLHLCGVGLTGIAGWEYLNDPKQWQALRDCAHFGVDSMADELNLPRAKATTTIKPSGTLSKIMDCTEGIHKPLGKYIINRINFGKHDPLVELLRNANYEVIEHPYDPTAYLVALPVKYTDVEFTKTTINGRNVEVNVESAVDQLNRYKLVMENYVDHNASVTISYSPDEVTDIVNWLYENWDTYVGVSFLYRNDPTKTAQDLGYPYLPQTVVTEEEFEEYVSKLIPINIDGVTGPVSEVDDDCVSGVCPVR